MTSHTLPRRPHAPAGLLAIGLALLTSACATEPPATADGPPDTPALTVTDPWTKAVDGGMTAVFGTLTNSSDQDVELVAADSDAAEQVELHVFTDDDGTPVMREADGLVIPADGELTLEPGGAHIMLIDVTEPLEPGADVTVTVTTRDDTELEITAPVRSFAGADEEYAPEDKAGHDHSDEHAPEEHGGHDDHDDHGEDE